MVLLGGFADNSSVRTVPYNVFGIFFIPFALQNNTQNRAKGIDDILLNYIEHSVVSRSLK